jgi:hypothetical protein
MYGKLLLSMSKSLDYQVPDRIKCDVKVKIRKSEADSRSIH